MTTSLSNKPPVVESLRPQGTDGRFFDDRAPLPQARGFGHQELKPGDPGAAGNGDPFQHRDPPPSASPDSTDSELTFGEANAISALLDAGRGDEHQRTCLENEDFNSKAFQSIVRAAAPYRTGRQLDYLNHRIDCSLRSNLGRYFNCYLDYEPDNQHFVTLVVRLAHGFAPEAPEAARLFFRAGACCRLARVVAQEDGHVFVKAFAVDVQHLKTIPTVIRSIFAETLRILNDDLLWNALDVGKAALDGEPDPLCSAL